MIICLVFVALTDALFYCHVKMQILQVSNCQSRGYIMAVNTNEHTKIIIKENITCVMVGDKIGNFSNSLTVMVGRYAQ